MGVFLEGGFYTNAISHSCSTRPGMPSCETRNLIKSPSQKSGVGNVNSNNNNNNSNNNNNNSTTSGGGDVEVRVRTTARGTSVSVLLPSASGSATAVDSNQPVSTFIDTFGRSTAIYLLLKFKFKSLKDFLNSAHMISNFWF